jgi:two-component system sensor histidine kinase KdpD
VGKTYAMLAAAQRERLAGRRVLVGLVETHGRAETEQQLHDLELLPRRPLNYQGKQLTEFDLDAALARRPDVLLLDELAHSNVSGSRHPKRWQDVQELLEAGIEVWTTLNVQHLESLNDVVGGIVGIQVHETVPDHMFDDADEVIVVDIPPEELLKRLKAGKVYPLEQAERASRNFFRQGNLLALRELALRRTADRVDEDMRDYRRERSIGDVWPTRERLLVGVGGRAGDDALVRQVARLARRLEADWVVVYVDAPQRQHRPGRRRRPCSRPWRWPRAWARKRPPFPVPMWRRPWWTSRASAMPAIWCWPGAPALEPLAAWRPASLSEQIALLDPGLDVLLLSVKKASLTAPCACPWRASRRFRGRAMRA